MLNPGVESAGIGTAIVFALWNYFGWDSVTTTLAEIPDAPRRVPKSVLIAVGMVTAMIVLPVFAALALKTDWPNWASDAGYWPEIASSAWLPLRSVVILGGVVSNVGQFNANLLASSRIPYVLSRRNCLPRVFSLEHPLFRTPWVGIAFGGILSALLASESFEKLVAIDLSLYLIALILECGALVKLRRGLLIEPKSHFQIGGGQLGLILCAAFPILIGVIAICLQLSPSLHIADTTINPISIFVGLALSGPIVYAAGLASKRLGAK
jgi:amino acid transporter